MLRDRLVQVRVKGLAGRIDLFQTGFEQNFFKLLMNHIDAGLQLLHAASLGILRGCQRHVKIIQHRNQLFQQALIGIFYGLLFLSRHSLFEILHLSRGAQQTLPMLIRFGRSVLQVLKLLRCDGSRI